MDVQRPVKHDQGRIGPPAEGGRRKQGRQRLAVLRRAIAHFPPARATSCEFSSNAAMIASSSDSRGLERFCVSITRR